MKKLLILVSLLLLLTGCGKESITGEVQSVTSRDGYVELILVGMEDRIFADENTFVYSFSGIEEGLLEGSLIRPIISAEELRRTKGGYSAQRICVESTILPEPHVLSDGTPLNIRTGYHGNLYETQDGYEILWEQEPVGPENVSVGGLPTLRDLPEKAQEAITAYYASLGLLYDLDAELEKAYEAFLTSENKNLFQSRHLAQSICPTAANQQLVWFAAFITEPIGSGLVHERRMGTVFHRNTGQIVDYAELFTCTEDAVCQRILDIAGMPDTQLRKHMEKAFRLDYILFHSSNLDVHFPVRSLPGETQDHIIGIDYADLEGLLCQWAIPDPSE